jgi:hypothetical protein
VQSVPASARHEILGLLDGGIAIELETKLPLGPEDDPRRERSTNS